MRKLFYCFTLSFIAFGLFSCQKEISLDTTTTSGGTGGSGNGGSGGSGSGGGSTSSTYQPLTAGSYWKLKDSASGTIKQLTCTNRNVMIGGKQYTSFFTSDPAPYDSIWFRIQGPTYSVLESAATPQGSATIEFQYLNDTQPVGYNWTYSAGQANGFPATMKTTILEKGISITVQGRTFTEVIHTQMELTYNIMGQSLPAGTYDYYVAKNIGMVKTISSIGGMGFSMRTVSELVDYHIN